jgi:hypothetical protein
MDSHGKISDAIKRVVTTMMDRVMIRVLSEDPFIKETHHAGKPIYAALVPDEIFKGSHFERRFVTPFGRVWENLAQVVATEAHGHCVMGHIIEGNIGSERLRRIQETLNGLEHVTKGAKRIKPNWDEELAYILAGGGPLIPVSVTCDIFIRNESTGERFAFELKGPLPYNPYGKREDYKWTFPMRWFDMQKDSAVLIGDEFWDKVGGNGTYQHFIKEINALGKVYRERIYKEFLGIEPPLEEETYLLK